MTLWVSSKENYNIPFFMESSNVFVMIRTWKKLNRSNCSITKLENFAHNVRRIYRNARLKRAATHESRSLLRTWCYSESSQRTLYLINLKKMVRTQALVFIRCNESWLALFYDFYSTNKCKTFPWVLLPRHINVSMHIFHQGW